jgi:hypothetical protein
MFVHLELNYGDAGAGAAVPITDDDRAWGLAPADDYAQILRRTFDRDYLPRFMARGIDPAPAWSARLARYTGTH